MRVIIAGGRDFTNFQQLADNLDRLFADDVDVEVASGAQRGADAEGERYAEFRADEGWTVTRFPADWDKHGKAAGPIRNAEMAAYADVLVAFWDGKSRGTSNMIQTALKAGLEVHVYRY